MKTKSILFIGNYFNQGRVWEEIPERLKEFGYTTFTTSSIKSRLLRLIDMLFAVASKRNVYDVAVVDVFSGLSFIWAELVAFMLHEFKKPFILFLHGGRLVEFSNENHNRVNKLLNSANLIVTPSKFLQAGLQKFRSDIIYLPNGLDLSRFSYIHRLKVKPRLVWLRALHKIYMPEIAIQALKILNRDFPNIRLVLIGQDNYDGTRERIEKLSLDLDLRNSVSWIGSVSRYEVPCNLQQSDIFLNTTLYESFGTSVLEAAACGLCIVTTNVGELPYLWEDGLDALLVPPNDPNALAAAVKRILVEPDLSQSLSENARKKAEKFDWSVIMPQWESLFDGFVSHG